jgi:hypothetical protein
MEFTHVLVALIVVVLVLAVIALVVWALVSTIGRNRAQARAAKAQTPPQP